MNNKNSTYRSKLHTLLPNKENKITFEDTSPNHVIVQNYNQQSNIYIVGVGVASPKYYDEKITGIGKVLLAQDNSFPSISIYVEGTENVQLKIMSFTKEFSPSSINTSNINIASAGGGGGTGDGIVRGFTSSLPSGTNQLGSVSISSMPEIKTAIETLPAGNNKIGKVEVLNQLPLVESSANIGRVTVANELTIRSMPPINLSGAIQIDNTEFSIKNNSSYDGGTINLSTTETLKDYMTNPMQKLVFLCNDSETATVDFKLNDGVFIQLKPSESVGGLDMIINSITLKASATNTPIRFMVVK